MWGRGARVAAALAVLLLASSAYASPPDIFGFGARTQAMGMTGTSYVDDYEAVYSNPAGLSRATRAGFNLGLQVGKFELSLDGERTPLVPYGGFTIGMQMPLPFGGVLEDVLVIGAGFYAPNGSVLQTDIIFPETASWVLLNRSQSVHLQLGLGIDLSRLVPGLRVGAGFAALANIRGRLSVVIDDANQFVSETETQLLASFNPIVGAQYDIGPVSIGFTWHDDVESDIALNVVTALPVDLPIITITATPQYDPHLFSLEVAYRPIDDLLIAAALNTRLWSRYGGVVGRSTSNSNLPPAPDFRNTYSPRIGAEYSMHRRRTTALLRAGYAFEMSPAPNAALRPGRDFNGDPRMQGDEVVMLPVRYLDNHRHVATLGGGIRWRAGDTAVVKFDMFSQFHRLTDRTHDIGQSEGGPPMQTGGWILAGGWNVSLEW